MAQTLFFQLSQSEGGYAKDVLIYRMLILNKVKKNGKNDNYYVHCRSFDVNYCGDK